MPPVSAESPRVVLRAGALVVVVVMALATLAGAHPGRLDAEGCHQVKTRYAHRSGKVDEPGTVHCHRLKQGRPAILDGREQLADPTHPDADAPRDDEPGPAEADGVSPGVGR